MNYTANWNMLDSIIFFLEGKIGRVKTAVKNSKDEDPDVELMIQAETEHLRTENETLKKRETPAYLIEDEGQYFCPKCRMKIVDTVKYCPNCGHRVMRAVGSNYSVKE